MNVSRVSTESGSGGKVRNFMSRSAGLTVELERQAPPAMHNFVSIPPDQTGLISEVESDFVLYETKVLDTGSYQKKQQIGLEKISAVVEKVDAGEVILSCMLPQETLEVSLPRDLVPDSLAKYGTPVFLSIEVINGYKTPSVTEREVPRLTQEGNPFADIESWLQKT